MHRFGETPRDRNFHDRQSDRSNLEWKFASKACKPTEKLNLPIIQPTVIQALPSFHQTLTKRLNLKEKRCPPNSPTKEGKTESKPLDKSAIGRVLPSLPRIEESTLPSVAKRTVPSSRQVPIVPTIEERSLPSTELPEIKLRTRVRKVRRVLPIIPASQTRTPPSIPLPKTRDPPTFPPSIKPIAVKALSKWRGARRKRLLPSLPTIEERNSPKPTDETATEQEITREGSSTSQEKRMPTSLQQIRKSPLASLPQEKNDLRSKEEDIQMLKPLKTQEVQQGTKKLAKDAKTKIHSNKNQACPSLKPIDKELLHSPKTKAQQKEAKISSKDKGASQLKGKDIPRKLHKQREEDSSEEMVHQTVLMPELMRGADAMADFLSGKQRPCVKGFSTSSCLEAKEMLSSCSRRNRQAKLDTQQAANQSLPRLSTERLAKTSSQGSEEGALPRLRATAKLIKKDGESKVEKESPSFAKKEAPINSATMTTSNENHRKCTQLPTFRVSGASAKWSELKEVMQRREPHPKRQNTSEMYNKINQNRPNLSSVDSYALLNRMRRDSESSLQTTGQQRRNVHKRSFQPKVTSQAGSSLLSSSSYSLLKLKREQFETLPRLRLIAKRNHTETRPLAEERNSRILTVKPALPCIQYPQESKTPKLPTATIPVVKKGLPSARPKAQAKCQMRVSRPLPNIQPVVKQALPSLNSSSLQKLVKKPIPSVQGGKDSYSPDHVHMT